MTAAHIAEAEAFMKTRTRADNADTAPCAACGRRWPILVLDGKPDPKEAEPLIRAALAEGRSPAEAVEGLDYSRLEGPCCYGEDYSTP